MGGTRVYVNRDGLERVDVAPNTRPRDFHRRMPGYSVTPLVSASRIAQQLGVAEVWVKVESQRLGLSSFKILGASWAVYRALEERLGGFEPWEDLAQLGQQVRSRVGPLELATATDGNHGLAVARMARLLGLKAKVFVPAGTARARIEAIEREGATVCAVDGTYDEAVERAAAEANPRCLVIADTAIRGDEPAPRWVIEGYSTIFWEVEEQLATLGAATPDLVVVQIGVGALACAAVSHFRRPSARRVPKLLSVEPLSAACMLASVEAGRPVLVPGPHTSIMAGLNCGKPSLVAWPVVSRGMDVFLAIDDRYVPAAVRALAAEGIEAGETGAAGLAGLLALQGDADDAALEGARRRLGLGPATRVLLICTEGATNPETYRAILTS